MRYGVSLIAAGVLALGVCGAGQAAQSGFTDQKGDGFTIEVPSKWQVAPKDFLDKIQKSQAGQGGKMLMLIQGPDENGMPKIVIMERNDPGATPENLAALSDSDAKAWCDTVKENLKKQTGKDMDVSCGKTSIPAGTALYMEMTLPTTGGADMRSLTWTIPHKDTSVVASVMFPKADESKDLPLVKKMVESLKFTK